MKRINPATGVSFKKGDVRENGDVFYQYRKVVKPWSAPYFVEYWLKPEAFKYHNHTRRSGKDRKASEIASRMLKNAKDRCTGTKSREKQGRKATNGIVTIDKQWILERLERGVCEATGDILTMSSKQSNSPSLDRIDPSNPNYTPDNCRITTWQFNNMKGAFTDEEFIRVAEALKNVRQKQSTITPDHGARESQNNSELGTVHGVRIGEDCDGSHHHRGEPEGEDPCDSTQASCRICMGSGSKQLEALELYEGRASYGLTDAETESLAKLFGCVCYQR